jgi:hypothetical protein
MNRSTVFLFLVLTSLVAPLSAAEEAEAAKIPSSVPLSPRFKQVRERIDALFEHRNQPPPPPEARLNPFRPPGVLTDAQSAAMPTDSPLLITTPVPNVPSSDLTRLQESVATLKVSGTFEKEGQVYLVINQKPYKDNEVIPTQVRGETIYLRIRQVSRRGVTVALNEAEMTLKF